MEMRAVRMIFSYTLMMVQRIYTMINQYRDAGNSKGFHLYHVTIQLHLEQYPDNFPATFRAKFRLIRIRNGATVDGALM